MQNPSDQSQNQGSTGQDPLDYQQSGQQFGQDSSTQGIQGTQGTQPTQERTQGMASQFQGTQGTQQATQGTQGGEGDFLDKGLAYAGQKSGHPQSAGTTEKASDSLRSGFKKATGRDVPFQDKDSSQSQ